MAQDDDQINTGIGGIFQGIGEAFKNQYNIQMARKQLDMKQQDLDNDTKYKNAQVDYLEGRGQLAGAQADAWRFNIDQADKVGQTKLDAANDNVDAAHMQVQQQATGYRAMLNQALQTPEGQEYVANNMSGANDGTGGNAGFSGAPPAAGAAPSATGISGAGSPVVNNVMPGVGATQPNAYPNNSPVSRGYAPLSTQGNAKAISGQGVTGQHRNASLQKAMGNIDSMGIDNRDDAQYAMEKYYGADWSQNPEAVQFMNSKFGNPGTANAGQPAAAGTPTNQGNASPQQAQGNANDLVPVTGPDGNSYKVPRANLQKAIQRGYRVRQQ